MTALPMRPYPGLRSFQQDESAVFHGRDHQSIRMLTTLARHHFLAVLGSSGCGKSSLVHAGLIPALKDPDTCFDDSTREWVSVVSRPGGGPFRNLAVELAQACPETDAVDPEKVKKVLSSGTDGLIDAIYSVPGFSSRNVLIVIDQFEEIFRFGDTTHRSITELERTDLHNEALAFVDTLLSAADARNPQIYVAITMRSDSLGRCDMFHGLPEAITRSQFLPPRLTKAQLLDAIRKPAELFGSTIEDTVVSDLLEAMGDRQDQLPVIQHALAQLWENASPSDNAPQNSPREITRVHAESCRRSGSESSRLAWVTDAISTHADEVLHSLTDPNALAKRGDDRPSKEVSRRPEIARRMFCALSQIDNNDEPERRLSSIEEVSKIVFGPKPTENQRLEVERVVSVFAKDGTSFVFPSSTTDGREALDISHESLLRQWHTFREWLKEEKEAAAKFGRLLGMANAWSTVDEHGNREGGLLDSETLIFMERWWRGLDAPSPEWAARYSSAPTAGQGNASESAFNRVDDYISRSHSQVTEQTEKERKREEQLREAQRQRLKNAEQLAAERQKMVEQKQKRVVYQWAAIIALIVISGISLYLRQKAEEAKTSANNAKRKAVEMESDAKKATKVARDLAVEFGVFRENNASLVSGLESAYNDLWKHTVEAIRSTKSVLAWDELAKLTDKELDPIEPTTVPASNSLLITRYLGNKASVRDTAVSRNLEWVASAGEDRNVSVWDLAGDLKFQKRASSEAVASIGFTSNSEQVLAGSSRNRLTVFNLPSGEEAIRLQFHTDAVIDIRESPDGSLMAAASRDGSVSLWDVGAVISKENLPSRTTLTTSSPLTKVRFSADGSRLVTSSTNETVQIWDTATSDRLLELNTRAITRDCQFSPVNREIVAGGSGEKVMVVNAEKNWLFLFDEGNTTEEHEGSVNGVAFSPDGTHLASIGADGRCLIWDIRSVTQFAPPNYANYPKFVIELDTKIGGRLLKILWNGSQIVLGGEDGQVEGWDLSTIDSPSRNFTLAAHTAPVRGLSLLKGQDQLLTWSAAISNDAPSPRGKAALFSDKLRPKLDSDIKRWDLQVARRQYSWRGDWKFTFQGPEEPQNGLLTLSLTGQDQDLSVWGSFRFGGKDGTIRGKLSADGQTLKGQWDNSAGESGQLTLRLQKTLESFDGEYSMSDSPPDFASKNKWTGTKSRRDLDGVTKLKAQNLANTKIGIYVRKGDEPAVERAERVSAFLKSIVPASTVVEVYLRESRHFQAMLRAIGNEVRWDTEDEADQAATLADILNEKGFDPGEFGTREVTNAIGRPTYGFLSIFFAP